MIIEVVERICDIARVAIGVKEIDSFSVIGTIFYVRTNAARAGLNEKLRS